MRLFRQLFNRKKPSSHLVVYSIHQGNSSKPIREEIRTVPLYPDTPVSIGREDSRDVPIKHDGLTRLDISRDQWHITHSAQGTITVLDRGRNKTKINGLAHPHGTGSKESTHSIKHGDIVSTEQGTVQVVVSTDGKLHKNIGKKKTFKAYVEKNYG
jgi:hypothetical protein